MLFSLEKNKKKINQCIEKNLLHWKQDRIVTILNIILQLALAEKYFSIHLPYQIILNEYLKIADLFMEKKLVKFCNAILESSLQ